MAASSKSAFYGAILFGIYIFIIESVGAIYIGPFSPRQYFIILSIIYLFFHTSVIVRERYKPTTILFAYYIFVFLLGLISDLYTTPTGVTVVFARMFPAIIIYFFTLASIKSLDSLKYVIYVALFIVFVDAVATILQGLNNPIGWAFALAFAPDSETIMENSTYLLTNSGTSIGNSVTSGIMGTVVANGYFLGSFGLLHIVPLTINSSKKNFVICIILFLLFAVALFYNQQRSAFGIYIALSFFLWYKVLSKKHKFFYIFIILVAGLIIFNNINFDNIELGRFEGMESKDISSRNQNFIGYFSDYFLKNPILGQYAAYEATHDGVTPHNLFAEATLQGGLFGLIIFVWFLVSLMASFAKHYFKGSLLSKVLIFPILSIILISFTHSSGYHTGMSCAIFLLAFYVISLKYEGVVVK